MTVPNELQRLLLHNAAFTPPPRIMAECRICHGPAARPRRTHAHMWFRIESSTVLRQGRAGSVGARSGAFRQCSGSILARPAPLASMDSTMLHCRLALLADVPSLLALMRSLQEDDPWPIPFDEGRVLSDLEALISTPQYGQVWLLAEAPDTPAIGYLLICFDYSLEYGGRGAWIDEVFIDRRRRGQGLGAQALRLAEEAAREAGAKVLHLEVNRGNRAIELYRRSGFQDHDRYLMSKRL